MPSSEIFIGGQPLKAGRNSLPSGLIDLTTADGQHFNISLESSEAYALAVHHHGDKLVFSKYV